MITRVKVGSTPLVEIDGVLVKLEYLNPTGSIKDRIVSYILKKSKLDKGTKILEVTSGNTGISLAFFSALYGYSFTAVMPEDMSDERKSIIRSYGGELILTPKEKDVIGAVEKYNEIKDAYFCPDQFSNELNIEAQYTGLGKEIVGLEPDFFIAGVGTGGTLIGAGTALKEKKPTRLVAVEPEESSVLLGNEPKKHGIQGIGEGFIPPLVKKNLRLIDHVIAIRTSDAIDEMRRLQRRGYYVGISSGANLLAAKRFNRYGKVLTVFPDRGDRYMSI